MNRATASHCIMEMEMEAEMGFEEKLKRCYEYVEELEKERVKIQVFGRELPLSLELVTQALAACRKELSLATTTTIECMNVQSECCSEQTTSTDRGRVLEEFVPLKNDLSVSDNEDDEVEDEQKSDWLRSAQLWNNQSSDPAQKQDGDAIEKKSAVDMKCHGGAFQPFMKEKSEKISESTPPKLPSLAPTTAASSTAETLSGGGGSSDKKEEKEGNSNRKQRRNWSPELHKRFLHALQQLGGSQVATPKQIRELMKVDGLTNDEVKSHLQKFRLHTRRPSSTHNTSNTQQPQFLVVGGIWVPPPEYSTVAREEATTATPSFNGIYAPVASLPAKGSHLPKMTESEEEKGSHNTGGVQPDSPTSSCSTHNTSMASHEL